MFPSARWPRYSGCVGSRRKTVFLPLALGIVIAELTRFWCWPGHRTQRAWVAETAADSRLTCSLAWLPLWRAGVADVTVTPPSGPQIVHRYSDRLLDHYERWHQTSLMVITFWMVMKCLRASSKAVKACCGADPERSSTALFTHATVQEGSCRHPPLYEKAAQEVRSVVTTVTGISQSYESGMRKQACRCVHRAESYSHGDYLRPFA